MSDSTRDNAHQNASGAAVATVGVDPTSAAEVDGGPEADRPTAGPNGGIALCLSGGGYRAMLFHLGALWRLNELGWLSKLDRISSVSGGSITTGALALAWRNLDFTGGAALQFVSEVVEPVRRLARHTIDIWSVLGGVLMSQPIGERIAKAYDKHLFRGATLQDLPDEPRFVFNASNVQSGALFRFSKPYIRDWRVGKIPHPRLRLALAVAASSAFPPVLSPLVLRFDDSDYEPGSGSDLQHEPFTTRAVLTDGGVYDNLGLETAWRAHRTILVSNGGGKMTEEPKPHTDWFRHMRRVLDIIDNQVRSLRQRQATGAFTLPREGPAWRDGAYWGIRTNISNYGLTSVLPCPHLDTLRLANVATRLKKMDDRLQERLINWGYAVCDAAMRRHVLNGGQAAPAFPYPRVGVG